MNSDSETDESPSFPPESVRDLPDEAKEIADESPRYPPESVRDIVGRFGVSDLSDEAAKVIADEITMIFKVVMQDSIVFMEHSKRQKLMSSDVDNGVQIRFHHLSGDSDVPLPNVPDLPPEDRVGTHWLAINGVPTFQDNPFQKQKVESMQEKPLVFGKHKFTQSEPVLVKPLSIHELSLEQQHYYKDVTEACVGFNETKRIEALQGLSVNPGLHEMLPRLSIFISEGVKVNVVQGNLAILIYLMRMLKSILENETVYIEKYLHELIPAVVTCIVSKKLSSSEVENHWTLRDFGAKLIAQICQKFNTSTNNIQIRVTRIFASAFTKGNISLSSLYGAIIGLAELGLGVVNIFVVPKIKFISDRIEVCSKSDPRSAGILTSLIMRTLPPLIRVVRSTHLYEDYKSEFGFLGPSLYFAVSKAKPAMGVSQNGSFAQAGNRPMNSQKRFFSLSSSSNPQSVLLQGRKPENGKAGQSIPSEEGKAQLGHQNGTEEMTQGKVPSQEKMLLVSQLGNGKTESIQSSETQQKDPQSSTSMEAKVTLVDPNQLSLGTEDSKMEFDLETKTEELPDCQQFPLLKAKLSFLRQLPETAKEDIAETYLSQSISSQGEN